MVKQWLYGALFVGIGSLFLIACGDGDPYAIDDNDCTEFCVGENAASGSTTPSRDEEIQGFCRDICAQEVECGNIAPEEQTSCLAECTPEAEDFLLDADQACFEAGRDMVECVTNLSCNEFSGMESYCTDEIVKFDNLCEDEPVVNGTGGGEPNSNTGSGSNSANDPIGPSPTLEERIETVCRDGCTQVINCDSLPETEYPDCLQDCQDSAWESYQDSRDTCFEAQLHAAECISPLSCPQRDNMDTICADELDVIDEQCPNRDGSSDGF